MQLESRSQLIDCGPPVNHSEEVAREHIARWLHHEATEPWTVLFNLMVSYKPFESPDELDVVAISTRGILAIEVKHWDGEYLRTHPEMSRLEAEKLEKKARRLKGRVQQVSNRLWVEGRFLLTRAARASLKPVQGIRLFTLREIPELFDCSSQESVITTSQVVEIVKLLQPHAEPLINGRIRRFHNLENLKLVTPPTERFHREYRAIQTKSRQRVVLHWFDLSAAEHKKPEELAEREFRSYQLLQKEPFVPRIIDSFQQASEYPGEVYFFTISDPMAPSLRERASDVSWTLPDRLAFAVKCCQALMRIHQPSDHSGVPPLLHRRLSPDCILVAYNNEPIFTRFRWAKIADAETIARGYAIKEEGDQIYTAPEIRTGGLGVADVRSDIYSLCVSLKLALDASNEAMELLTQGTREDPDQRPDLEFIAQELEKLVREEKTTVESAQEIPPEFWSEGSILQTYKVGPTAYRVLQELGSGGIGRSFKVVEFDLGSGEEYGLYVAKTVQREEDSAAILAAYRRVRPLIQEGAAKVYEVAPQWSPAKPMALLQWIPGDPLKSYAGVLSVYAEEDLHWPLDSLIEEWVRNICSALAPLHRQQVVHGDISPSNVIVDGTRITLTDYDAVTPAGQIARLDNPEFASPEVQEGQPIYPSDDIFSLAATLAAVILDDDPFRWNGVHAPGRGICIERLPFESGSPLREFFERATAAVREERFSDADAVLAFFHKVEGRTQLSSRPVGPHVVPRLKEILASYPASRYGNQETRGLDSTFAAETYVETALDRNLYRDIVSGQANLVILLGNAGDGKTALLQHLVEKLLATTVPSVQRVIRGRLEDGRELYVNLDGSAAHQGRSSRSLLDEFFSPFMGREFPIDRVHLLAINSGPLKQWVEEAEDCELTEALSRALLGELVEFGRLRVIDLNARSLVGHLEKGAIVSEFLNELIDHLLMGSSPSDPWEKCPDCTAKARCTAFRTVTLLRHPELGPRVRQRFGDLLRLVHQRGEVHITARELRAALSFGFFGTYVCEDLHQNPELTELPFWDRMFGDFDGRQGQLLREIAWLDPALTAEPALDRQLLKEGHGERLESLRRRAYFLEAEPNRVPSLHQGAYFEQFSALVTASDEERQQTLSDLLEGLSRLGNLPSKVISQAQGLCLRVPARAETESLFWVEKPRDRFHLQLPAPSPYVPWLPTSAVLVYRGPNGFEEVLVLSYELFAFLMAAKDGAQFSADVRSSDVFTRLAIFTQRLAEEDRRRIWAWNPLDPDAVYRVEVEAAEGSQEIRVVKEREAWPEIIAR
ncbi:MAG: NERD domain-containing protein [Firmicutes bacterium]|nr:NERD domain-containing protein [Bacillota bacterium]